MKIAVVHNEYKQFSGEEAVVADMCRVLEERGQLVCRFIRRSADIPQMRFGKLKAFTQGIYNPFIKKDFRAFLLAEKPDIVHVHNLYPLISPSILPICRKLGIPVVMTLHNYRLACPGGVFYRHGMICEECAGGREWRSIIHNCQNSRFKTLGYALRNWSARVLRLYHDNVDVFLALTEFQKRKLKEYGLPEQRIVVLPNMTREIEFHPSREHDMVPYVAYAGRLCPEKGIDVILDAAARLPHVKFRLAGPGAELYREKASPNVEFCGMLSKEELITFYGCCRLAIMASVWYEGFPTVLPELMCLRKPLIVPALGGFPEIVRDGKTGLLFRAGDAADLAKKITTLIANEVLCDTFGKEGHAVYRACYSAEVYGNKLLEVYNRLLL